MLRLSASKLLIQIRFAILLSIRQKSCVCKPPIVCSDQDIIQTKADVKNASFVRFNILNVCSANVI